MNHTQKQRKLLHRHSKVKEVQLGSQICGGMK